MNAPEPQPRAWVRGFRLIGHVVRVFALVLAVCLALAVLALEFASRWSTRQLELPVARPDDLHTDARLRDAICLQLGFESCADEVSGNIPAWSYRLFRNVRSGGRDPSCAMDFLADHATWTLGGFSPRLPRRIAAMLWLERHANTKQVIDLLLNADRGASPSFASRLRDAHGDDVHAWREDQIAVAAVLLMPRSRNHLGCPKDFAKQTERLLRERGDPTAKLERDPADLLCDPCHVASPIPSTIDADAP